MAASVACVQRADVLDALRWIVDPEIGVDIVTLGLIYGIAIADGAVRVSMTMTARGCPLHAAITEAIADAIRWLPGVETVNVELVWEPPWHPAMLGRVPAA
jgi:metal-sulfur cluster biosynthetic enzyme